MTTLRECLDNLRDFNISELESIRSRVVFLMGTKQREETRVQNIDRLIAEHQESQGREPGADWVQPTSAMDAYPVGAVVTHEGQKWRSTTPANVWSPGQSGWRQLSEDGTPPEFSPPTGAHDSYQEGERVTFEGEVYEAVRNGVVHSPAEYAPDWRLIEDGEDDDPDEDEGHEDTEPEPEDPAPEEPTDPEEPEPGDGDGDEDDEPTEPEEPEPEPDEPAPAEWVQPTGGHDAYNTGDRVLWQGSVYESVMDGNVWSPTDYSAGWKLIQ